MATAGGAGPLAALYAQYGNHPGVVGALRGMVAVTAGLIAATGAGTQCIVRCADGLIGWFLPS
ncbi:hypothetical protein [Duganella margarita]|uniref:hypothetical protein n=1 Tax=Duganella margarita TaxID=2692170 RepID=UPI0035308BEB